jgi:hypothetical protein
MALHKKALEDGGALYTNNSGREEEVTLENFFIT